MKIWSLALAFLFLATAAHAGIVVKTQEYKQGDTVLEGKLVYDDSAKGKVPGVLVVHQWMGPTDYELGRAKQLAGLGYAAFVADIYGKGVRPKNQEEAAKAAGIYRSDPALFRARVNAGLAQLRNADVVDQKKIAAIGYCFGGGAVLELARSGATISGIVSFHGSLGTGAPAKAGSIHTPLLVLHGADDPYVNTGQVAGFKKEMDTAGAEYEFIAYPGAVHAFTQKGAGSDNSKGAAYNAKADADSWEKMKAFFARIF